MLAIAVAIIAVPSRPIRRIGLEKAVDNGDALEDQRIVGLPEAEPHELEEIRPDHLAGGDPRMVGAIAERDRLPHRRGSLFEHLRRRDPCIITVRTRASRQLSAADREPAFDAGIPEICEIERPSWASAGRNAAPSTSAAM